MKVGTYIEQMKASIPELPPADREAMQDAVDLVESISKLVDHRRMSSCFFALPLLTQIVHNVIEKYREQTKGTKIEDGTEAEIVNAAHHVLEASVDILHECLGIGETEDEAFQRILEALPDEKNDA